MFTIFSLSFNDLKKKNPYQFLLEDHLSEPLEIQWFESGKNKKGVFFIVVALLDRSLWIGNPNGGFGPHVFAVTFYRGFIQPASTTKQCLSDWDLG